MIAAILLTLAAASNPAARATDVRTNGDDGLTQKFADALTKALPNARRMRPLAGDEDDDLRLAILSGVEAKDGRFSYMVDLLAARGGRSPDRLASFTGSCREDAIDSCAAKLVRQADGKVKG